MESKKVKMTEKHAEAILRAMVSFDIDIEWLDGGISLIDVNGNQAWVTIRDHGVCLGVSAGALISVLHVQIILRLADVASRIVCEEEREGEKVKIRPLVDWEEVGRYYGTAWRYAARDMDGLWYVYQKEPKINNEAGMWVGGDVRSLNSVYLTDSACDWRDSLVCRNDH